MSKSMFKRLSAQNPAAADLAAAIVADNNPVIPFELMYAVNKALTALGAFKLVAISDNVSLLTAQHPVKYRLVGMYGHTVQLNWNTGDSKPAESEVNSDAS